MKALVLFNQEANLTKYLKEVPKEPVLCEVFKRFNDRYFINVTKTNLPWKTSSHLCDRDQHGRRFTIVEDI